MQLASGCMWIWFADSLPALVGFLQALRFPPTPKNRNPFIFLVNSSGLSLCVQSLLGCLGFNYLCVCALRLSHSGALWTQWVGSRVVTKTANYYYYYYNNPNRPSVQTQMPMPRILHALRLLSLYCVQFCPRFPISNHDVDRPAF